METRRVLLALGLASVVVVPHQAAPTGLTLGVRGRSNANVSLAADGRFVVAVWAASVPGGATDIYAATSGDGGVTFQAPARVNATPGDARVNGEQPPRATLTRRSGAAPTTTIVWTSKGERGTRILSARSEDGGRTFGRTEPMPGGDAEGNRGWESAAVDVAGRVRVAWLDHRDMAPTGAAGVTMQHHHEGHERAPAVTRDGVAMAQQSALYMATIGDPSSPRILTRGVCYCCKTALVTGPDGAVYVAWRHVYPGNLRDVAFAMSRDGGRTFSSPLRVSEDRWQLDGCPDDGPSMARAADGRLHIVWPTLVSGDGPGAAPTIGLFHATSREGTTFSPRVRVPTEGVPHHPQLVVASNGTLVQVWDELQGGKRRAVLALGAVAGDGRVTFRRQALSSGDAAVYPTVAPTLDGVVVAWTSTESGASVIRVERRSVSG